MSGFPLTPAQRQALEATIKNGQVLKPDALFVKKIEVFPVISQEKVELFPKDDIYTQKLNVAKRAITYIMDNDKNCLSPDKAAQAEKIAMIAIDVGVPSEVIGAIIKQETHFSTNPAEMNKGNGVGPMQVTMITLHDMFVRPEQYDPDIKNIVGPKKKYKTFEEALKAKLNDNTVNLGKFGNKFFEFYKQNKTYFDKGYYRKRSLKDLPKSVRDKYVKTLSNYDMNVYLGCYIYKAHKKGNTEKQAIINYNGSPLKYKYESAVSDTIRQTRKNVPEVLQYKV